MRGALRIIIAIALTATIFSVPSAHAVTFNVTATGTSPAPCNQTAGVPSNVTAVRLSGGDCVITITGDTTWQIPYFSSNFQILIVGGGAAGMADGGGGGGGGGSLYLSSIALVAGKGTNIDIGAGGSGDAQTGGSPTQIDLNGDSTYDWTAAGGNTGTGWSTRQGGTGGAPSAQGSATVTTGGAGANGPSSTSSQSSASGTAGNGYNSSITGTSLYYGGGGGGGIGSQSGGTTSADLGINAGGFGGGGGGPAQRTKGTSVTWSYLGTGGGSQTLTAECVGASYAGTTPGFNGLNGFGGGGGGGSAYGDGCAATPDTNVDGERNRGGFGGSGVAIFRYTPDTTAPTFTVSSPYSFAENTSAATNVATIRTSESATIAFGVGGDQASFDLIFGDSTTAYLRFKSPPNYESPTDAGSNNGYDINLTATDPSGNVGSSSIVVNVTNVNEAPTITTNSSNATHLISLGENSTSVLTYTGSDIDANSTLSWSISGTDSGRFSIGTSSGVLTFLASPDFESASDFNQDNDYLLTITLSDGALTDTQTLTVRVTNINEAPTIGSFSSAAAASYSVIEGTTSLFNLNGSDVDANSTLTYSISGTDSSFFTVSGSGALSFASARNFENPQDFGGDNSYVVIAQVSDGTLTDTQTITVSITNLNEAPLISTNGSNSTYAISLSEGTSAVVTYTGSDVDAGSVLTWSISGTDSVLFTINANTGALSFLSAPDFEAPADSGHNNIYIVLITLSDGTLTDTQTLTITITNVNEAGSITAPSISGTAYKGVAITLNITTNTPGKVRFLVGGIRITNCLARATTGSYPNYIATCSWKPANIGSQKVTAVITPSDSTFSSATSAPASIWVYRRTTKR